MGLDAPLARFQLAIIAGAQSEGFLELRFAALGAGRGMRQEWHSAGRAASIAALPARVEDLSSHGDVYIGVAPRTRREGRASAVSEVWCLWADLDDAGARGALAGFPPPTLTVASGHGIHAYWSLREPLPGPDAERANRRIATHLGADIKSTDAARVLRPIGSLNWKDPEQPRLVQAIDCEVVQYDVLELMGDLPDTEVARPRVNSAAEQGRTPLEEIPARVYIPAICGREVDKEGFAFCPWHKGGEENHASLKVYGNSWCCYGQCPPIWGSGQQHLGGRIYHFAGKWWDYQLPLRGSDYLNVVQRLEEMFLEPDMRTT